MNDTYPPLPPPPDLDDPPRHKMGGCARALLVAAVAMGLFIVIGVLSAVAGVDDDETPTARSATTREAETTVPPTTATTAPPTTTTTAPPETAGQRNARQKAADYLEFQAFSRVGLIEQLEFEGFTPEDAAYGVDAQGADWNAQAAQKAADYLEFQSFSRAGLIDQLEFEGFTPAEAAYGVDTTGL